MKIILFVVEDFALHLVVYREIMIKDLALEILTHLKQIFSSIKTIQIIKRHSK